MPRKAARESKGQEKKLQRKLEAAQEREKLVRVRVANYDVDDTPRNVLSDFAAFSHFARCGTDLALEFSGASTARGIIFSAS